MNEKQLLFIKRIKEAREKSNISLAERCKTPEKTARLIYNSAQIEGINLSESRLIEIARNSENKDEAGILTGRD